MKQFRFVLMGGIVAGVIALVGCQGSPSAAPVKAAKPLADGDAEIKAALAKLSPADRALAEAQKTCPITGEPLGSMDTPVKLTLNGEPAFICCTGCQKKAEADPAATLKKVADLKAAK